MNISWFEHEANNGGAGWSEVMSCEKCGSKVTVPGGAYANVKSGRLNVSDFCSNKKCKGEHQ